MRIAICDDEEMFLINLDEMIREYCPPESLPAHIDRYLSGEELLDNFSVGKYDAIILDIQMKRLNGLQTANEIRKLDKTVIIAFHTSNRRLDCENYRIGDFLHMLKGQSAQTYKEQFSELFHKALH